MKFIQIITTYIILTKITSQSQILKIENQKNQINSKNSYKINLDKKLSEKKKSENLKERDINKGKFLKNQIETKKIISDEPIINRLTRELKQQEFLKIGEKGEKNKNKFENLKKAEKKTQKPKIASSSRPLQKRKLTLNPSSEKCNINFTSNLFGKDSQITSSGIPTEKKITDLCPLIKTSCCSSEDLNGFFSHITDQILNVYNREKGYLEDFIETTKKIDLEVIKAFFESEDGGALICVNLSGEEEVRQLFLDLKDEKLYQDILDYRNLIYREAFATVCSMCNSDNHRFFGVNEDGKFTISIQEPDEFFFYFKKLVLFKKLGNLEKLDNFYRCIYENENHFDPLKDLKKVFPDFIKTGKEDGIRNNKDVKEFIKEYYAPGNSNFYLFGSLNQKLKKLLFKEDMDENVRNSKYLVVPFDDKASAFIRTNLDISFSKEGYSLMDYKLINNDYFKNMKRVGANFEYESVNVVKVWIMTLIVFLF